MSVCATQTFQAITQGRFDCLVQKAGGWGVTISGIEGQTSKDGITVRWKFDPSNQTLELQCLDSPFSSRVGLLTTRFTILLTVAPNDYNWRSNIDHQRP